MKEPLPLPGFYQVTIERDQITASVGECVPRRRFEFFVAGEPRGMGSKTAFPIKRKDGTYGAVMTDSPSKAPHLAKLLPAWKDAVTAAAMVALGGGDTLLHAVSVELVFHLRRPAGHYNKAGKLLPSANRWPEGRPDLDKLQRSTLDAIKVSGLYADDARVVRATLAKVYAASNEPTGARIVVEEL